MILQALTQLYDDLLQRDLISRPGWSAVCVGYALCLDSDGNVLQFVPQVQEVMRGGKTVIQNRMMTLPAPVKRSSGVDPNFLCDNSQYILGVDNKGKPARSRECFAACAALHREILKNVCTECSEAILRFFDKWDPDTADENEIFAADREELIQGANITFRINGVYAHEDPPIANAWQNYYNASEGEQIRCLVTGEDDVLEPVHPAVKGVNGAQSSGAAVVSFNAEAYWSYGKKYGANATIGKKAAFAYTTALNYLLADRDNVQHIGDATVVCWARGAEPQYSSFSLAALFGAQRPAGLDENGLHAVVKRLADGLPCEEYDLDPCTDFYILGISPNAARLSVRFFYRSSFGELMRHINAHHERLQIVGSRYPYMPLWALMRETANLNSKDKSSSPVLTGAVARAIFADAPYPVGLLEAAMLRVRAERTITSGRAAIIKAYYLKNNSQSCPKEVLTVSLNENSTNIPYTIGRLFAVYEAAQEKANPGINATIRDKYFNSVAATPAHILPTLNNLYHKHLRKMDKGSQVYFEKQVSELLAILGDTMPTRLSLPEQGAFQLGYYHQQQKRYEKKEK